MRLLPFLDRTIQRCAAVLFLMAVSLGARGALPTPVPPSTGPAAGNWLELIKGYIKDGGLVLGLAISVIGFLWIAYIGISKFNDARTGRAEWAEVGLVAIVGGAVLLFAVFLLNEAATVI
ncbi:MAG: TIGR03745 family integrating conjugative element membrane protein [Gammaproteobacteria bacterium]|nr:TIGR03745 family integrating conjugative element membrane protein [Gammaproteobacteria bacterium]